MLEILYEDDALLFVNKPAGIVVQRGYDAEEPVLVEIAAAYAGTIFLMQRLDRGTSGVMFFSKLASINANLTRQFEGKRIRKRYLALCEGELGERQTIDAPLIRIGPISFGTGSFGPGEGGKRAITIVTPVRSTKTGSLAAIDLLTGRTHQIRVHLAAIGHPLIGDWLYGQRNDVRPMLHARELSMTHPLTNEPLRVEAPLPDDFLNTAAERGIVSRGEDMLTLDGCG
ncbi:MAG TPA: RluA family pseudouridine synthase [Thermoanaerobaculia bacterium]|jgi:RluA family pseudouridine synthase|nr:RluA family pseudouridine synthase [Thermoanaerobaculia bacterium]